MTLFTKMTALVATTFLVSCGPSLTPEQRATRAANIAANDAIWATRQTVSGGGTPYYVAVAPDRRYALVAPVTGKVFVQAQGMQAAAQVTGCTASPDLFLASLTGGDINAPMDLTNNRNVEHLRVELAC